MVGLKYDFEGQDLHIDPLTGAFITADTDNQNVALIALSQVCRLTQPEIGAQLPARIVNVRRSSVGSVFNDAMQQARKDGAKDVFVGFDSNNNLIFKGNYGS